MSIRFPDDDANLSVRTPTPSRQQRRAAGRELRSHVPRQSLGDCALPDDRIDPVDLIIASHQGRQQDLVPIRMARMTASPYGFLRGAANVCARDCASLPSTGITPIICGDAHLGNFGFYRSPEGELVIDLNDFDEAHPGAWEWDLRRLTTSVWVAGRENGLSEAQCGDAVFNCANAYRDEMDDLADLPLLARSFLRVDLNRLNETVSEPRLRDEVARAAAKAKKRTSDRALPNITNVDDGGLHIVNDPPLVQRLNDRRREQVAAALDRYLRTLPLQWRRVVGGYSLVDVAHKVVGVGSVGLRAFVALLEGASSDDVLFLQLKEARRSVLAPFVHGEEAHHEHQGQRVVEYQQALQTVSDPLLGWTTLPGVSVYGDRLMADAWVPDIHVYVRQWRNMKGAVLLDGLDASALADYARVLGMLLAKSHARTSGASLIVGYIGHSDVVAEAFARFAKAYADQTEADHQRLCQAMASGRLPGWARR